MTLFHLPKVYKIFLKRGSWEESTQISLYRYLQIPGQAAAQHLREEGYLSFFLWVLLEEPFLLCKP